MSAMALAARRRAAGSLRTPERRHAKKTSAWSGKLGQGLALLLCLALLLSLQRVLLKGVAQADQRRSILATQVPQAKQCLSLAGAGAQERCLLDMNAAARRAAEASPTLTAGAP